MDGILGVVAAAIGMFVGTNVDDLIVLTVLFLSSRATGRPAPGQIWAGQYLGIAALVAVSVVVALDLTVMPDRWVGLLGLVPFALGLRALVSAVRHHRAGEQGTTAVASTVPAIAGVTIANGADNISVYTPVFRMIGAAPTALTVAVFAAGVAVWCLAGSWLGAHPKVIAIIENYGQWIIPAVFMTIGIVIIVESGVLAHLW